MKKIRDWESRILDNSPGGLSDHESYDQNFDPQYRLSATVAMQRDPPGSTLESFYSYSPPTPRRGHRDASDRGADDEDSSPNPASTSSHSAATQTLTGHHLPTFKMQANEVPSEDQVANPHTHVVNAAIYSTLIQPPAANGVPNEVHVTNPPANVSNLIRTEELTNTIPMPIAEATLVGTNTTTNGFPPSPFMEQFRDRAFVSTLATLQQEIRKIETLADCREMYRRPTFTDSLVLIRSAQKEFMDASASAFSNPTDTRVSWAGKWAETKNLPRAASTEWAWILDQCRKTCLALVYKICDLIKAQDDSLLILRDNEDFGIILDTILNLCFVMDRANCLYHMGDDASNIRGLVWCRKDVHDSLPHHIKNPRGSLMNKRLMWLFDQQVLSEQTRTMLGPLLETAFPPRLRSNSN